MIFVFHKININRNYENNSIFMLEISNAWLVVTLDELAQGDIYSENALMLQEERVLAGLGVGLTRGFNQYPIHI